LVLDGGKNGLQVREDILAHDMQKFNKATPAWKTETDTLNDLPVIGPQRGTRNQFIMDFLRGAALEEQKAQHSIINMKVDKAKREMPRRDSDLEKPWKDAENRFEEWRKQDGGRFRLVEHLDASVLEQLKETSGSYRYGKVLEEVRNEVKKVYEVHRTMMRTGEITGDEETTGRGQGSSKREVGDPQEMTHRNQQSPGKRNKRGLSKRPGSSFSAKPQEDQQDALRKLSKDFHCKPSLEGLDPFISQEELSKLRASCAYDLDMQETQGRGSRFPFNMAMRELCLIKCKSNGNWKPVLSDFYERFSLRAP
jgi:hypothetical protein